MAKTPEGRVKDAIKTRLRDAGLIEAAKAPDVTPKHTGWYYMPVPYGYAVAGIPDFIGHYKGRFFSIEAKKAANVEPTPLQKHQIRAINATGGLSLVVGCTEDLTWFDSWVQKVDLGGV